MLIGLKWLNSLLSPGGVTADEAERALTDLGLPIESREEFDGPDGPDERLDIEVTSNRGDCLCHVGIAREVAAATGRKLVVPAPERPAGRGASETAPKVTTVTGVDNQAPGQCPRFTVRVIRGVKVGPSPAWLAARLESVGQRTINSVVDASNFVQLELGNPSHVFDMDRLTGKKLIVRFAREGEALTTLDGKARTLKSDELVVADAEKATSLAGVIGGLGSAVSAGTKDLLVEMATWDPQTVRRAARRHQVRTDASHRFERVVHPGTIDGAMERLVSLLLEVAGGELLPGTIDVGSMAGDAARARRTVALRPSRTDDLLGVATPIAEQARVLSAVGIECREGKGGAATLECVIPAERAADLTREVDLIEEVARLGGYERIPIEPVLRMTVGEPQASERAVREIGSVLTGLGLFETVTFSFLPKEQAESYRPWEARLIKVDEERRKGAPYLRPGVVPSLLACRRVNQDGGVKPEGGVRLFELGSGFQEWKDGAAWRQREFRSLALVMDAPEPQRGVREMRGVLEALVRALGGPRAAIEWAPCEPFCAAHGAGATALGTINGEACAGLTLIDSKAQALFGLDTPVVAAEVLLDALVRLYPARVIVEPLAAFPAIERDLSVVVDESVAWSRLEGVARAARLEKLVGVSFVGAFRGKQVGAGKKSVTLRLRFQDPARTLRHEEVDPQVGALVAALKREVGAELRA